MQPRDFFAQENKQQENKPVPAVRDFFGQPAAPDESFMESVGYAPGRVLTDTLKSAFHGFNKIPEYWESAKTEVPALLKTINNIPSQSPQDIASRESLMRQGKAGFAELGQKVFNTPHDIANYLSQRLHILPSNINNQIQMGRMPADTQQIINERYGMPTRPGEALLRGMARNLDVELPAGALAKGALSTTKNVLNRIHPQKVIESIQNHHDLMQSTASNIFKNVSNEAKKRNINAVPFRQNLIADITQYLPRTKGTKDLLDAAFTGDYDALRKLQSDLFKEGTSYSRSSLASERHVGQEIMSLRDEVNDSILNHFKNSGHPDLAADLNQARRIYADLQKTYYGKKTPSSIKNLVHPDSRKIPKNIMNVLNEQSVPMARIKKNNPFAEKQSKKYQKKLNAIQNLKDIYKATKIVGGAGLASIGLQHGPELYNKFMENNGE